MHAFIWPWPNTVAVVAAAPRAESPAAATDRRPAGRACLDPPGASWLPLGRERKKKRRIETVHGRRASFRLLFHRSSSSPPPGRLLFGSPVRILFPCCCCVTQESRTRISSVLAPSSCVLGAAAHVRPNELTRHLECRPPGVARYK